ncbi:MAG: bifunctional phosphoribosylaminoimidazolecarboxamide formyltransferase/IMP cyclohydrolase [Phycisphaerales bacterium]|jgi:phosphoribosylaminoimidazolecarboxamide formyltransferase/IMP cyclohydrolase|nr:bifunctional phosphoribosylaminoimidazolecarboxamide formyltransferase/IMP cyclohydrolase [Phycisphaerales bacterium]
MPHAPAVAPIAAPVKVRRALISVSDKTGIVEFCQALHALGVSIISTGGTAAALAKANIPVTPIEHITGLPEMMDGRVKTLHPAVHGGLLAVRDNPEHLAALTQHRIEPIDLVIINLYPFTQTIAKPGVSRAEAIENIDIGGPSMVRSAAKNHAYVAVVTSPDQYASVIADLRTNDGCTTPALRAELAQAAFAMTAAYDSAIATYLSSSDTAPTTFPDTLTLAFSKAQSLRYGENPHQSAAVYRRTSPVAPTVIPGPTTRQLHGKELSYNNLADAAGALECIRTLQEAGAAARGLSAVAIIKHANPCGAAVAPSVARAVDRAIAGDPVAAFGGILASSDIIDARAAERLAGKDTFLEVVIAPDYTPEALDILRSKSVNVRLLAVGPLDSPSASSERLMLRSIPGGLLVQERDLLAPHADTWQHVAGPKPTRELLLTAMTVECMVRCMASNAIAIGGIDGDSVRLFGGGVGQVDRVTACQLAVQKASLFAKDLLTTGGTYTVAVSDAFFPFPDGPQILIDAGVKAIVHPGGSKRDNETIDLCTKHNITCLLTGTRRFKH